MTLLHHIPAATEVDGRQTIADWYGYDSAGITVEQATFGAVDWTAGGTMEDLSPGTEYTAKLWMDAPVSTTNQTQVWMRLYRSDVEGTLDIGQQGVSDFYTFFLDESWITDPDYHQARSTNMTVTVVPEPSTCALLLLGALSLTIFATRRLNNCSSVRPLPLFVRERRGSQRATEWRGYSAEP